MKAPFLLGRLIFGGFFLLAGIQHFKDRRSTAQYASAKGVPLPELAVTATGAMMVAGGASVLLGVKPKLGTLAIIGFLAGVTPVMHDFWKATDPQQKKNEMVHFMKNLAMLGAAMALLGVDEPWPVSVPTGKRDRLEPIRPAGRGIDRCVEMPVKIPADGVAGGNVGGNIASTMAGLPAYLNQQNPGTQKTRHKGKQEAGYQPFHRIRVSGEQ